MLSNTAIYLLPWIHSESYTLLPSDMVVKKFFDISQQATSIPVRVGVAHYTPWAHLHPGQDQKDCCINVHYASVFNSLTQIS